MLLDTASLSNGIVEEKSVIVAQFFSISVLQLEPSMN
jgi:hypothetical protein